MQCSLDPIKWNDIRSIYCRGGDKLVVTINCEYNFELLAVNFTASLEKYKNAKRTY